MEDYAQEIVNSGFPDIRAMPSRARSARLDGYVDRIVERDFTEQDHAVRDPGALRRWMAAYAAATATTTSFETLRHAAAGPDGQASARSTTGRYRRVLEQPWMIDTVEAWLPTRHHLARLSGPAKIHLADRPRPHACSAPALRRCSPRC